MRHRRPNPADGLCTPCDSQCLTGCSGGTNTDCDGPCVHVKDGDACVPICPDGKYYCVYVWAYGVTPFCTECTVCKDYTIRCNDYDTV